MKKIFLCLFLLAFSAFGAVSSSTLTTVSANAVYYVSTEFGAGVQAKFINIYVGYTKGNETSIDITIAWMPDAYETWGSSTYYTIGERAGDETMQPVTLKFDTTGNTFYQIKVPAGVQRMYILPSYVGGTTGVMVLNTRKEK